MSIEDQLTEYRQFHVDLLNSKFRGTHTEAEMVERLILLYERKNTFALRALQSARLTCAPDSRMNSSIYKVGAIYELTNVAGNLDDR